MVRMRLYSAQPRSWRTPHKRTDNRAQKESPAHLDDACGQNRSGNLTHYRAAVSFNVEILCMIKDAIIHNPPEGVGVLV
jgi:hypothetical protein